MTDATKRFLERERRRLAALRQKAEPIEAYLAEMSEFDQRNVLRSLGQFVKGQDPKGSS